MTAKTTSPRRPARTTPPEESETEDQVSPRAHAPSTSDTKANPGDNQPKIGFVYVMTNEAQPGLVKIGICERHPYERVKDADLTSDAIPTPFVVRFYALVDDMQRACREAHDELTAVRVAKDFFRLSVSDAIDVINGTGVRIRFSESDKDPSEARTSTAPPTANDRAVESPGAPSTLPVAPMVAALANAARMDDDQAPVTAPPPGADAVQTVASNAHPPVAQDPERRAALDRAFNQIRASRWRHNNDPQPAPSPDDSHQEPLEATDEPASTATGDGRFFSDRRQTPGANTPFFEQQRSAEQPVPDPGASRKVTTVPTALDEPQLFRHVDQQPSAPAGPRDHAAQSYAPDAAATPPSATGHEDIESWVYKREAEQNLKQVRNYTLLFGFIGIVVGVFMGFAAFVIMDPDMFHAIFPWRTMGFMDEWMGGLIWSGLWGLVCLALAYMVTRYVNREKINTATVILRRR